MDRIVLIPQRGSNSRDAEAYGSKPRHIRFNPYEGVSRTALCCYFGSKSEIGQLFQSVE